MKKESTQRKLLNMRDLTLARALEIAEGMEAAERNIQQLHQGSHVAVHGVTQTCYHCGRNNHTPTDCHIKYDICHACKKKGHLTNVCCSKG